MKFQRQDILFQENFPFYSAGLAAQDTSTGVVTLTDGPQISPVISVNRYKQNGEAKKILGAVYTPPRVASALVRWAIRSRHDKVLDPSCGDGVFLSVARKHFSNIGNTKPSCIGVDINPEAAGASGAICSDFFEWASTAPQFDAIVGNPPFIRSHLFPEHSRTIAFQQMEQIGLRPSRLMSTWVPFIAISSTLLTERGRLAFVIPEELLHVNYAEELRRFLLSRFRRVILCVPNGSIFTSVQQSVVLLLCDNDNIGPAGLFVISFSHLENSHIHAIDPAPAWDWCPKWTHVFLSHNERTLVSEIFVNLGWKPLSEYGRVEVGVVTGYNDFFIVPKSKVKKLKADEFFTPIVTSARELSGIQFTSQDFRNLVKKDNSMFLLHTSKPIKSLPQPLQEYLVEGEKQGINHRYKCRTRKPWYAVPSIWPADALLLRQAGEIPRMVHLSMKCTSTDTVHRVRWHKPSLGKFYTASFLNTLSLIACELTGRSYGGGVLELMPGEANRIPLPPSPERLKSIFGRLDNLVRLRQYDKAIALVDQVVNPGRFTNMIEDSRNILSKLIARRKNKQNGHS